MDTVGNDTRRVSAFCDCCCPSAESCNMQLRKRNRIHRTAAEVLGRVEITFFMIDSFVFALTGDASLFELCLWFMCLFGKSEWVRSANQTFKRRSDLHLAQLRIPERLKPMIGILLFLRVSVKSTSLKTRVNVTIPSQPSSLLMQTHQYQTAISYVLLETARSRTKEIYVSVCIPSAASLGSISGRACHPTYGWTAL